MAANPADPAMDVDENDDLDEEIEVLKARVAALKARRAVVATNILASRSTQATLSRLRATIAGPLSPKPTPTASLPPSTQNPSDTNPLHQSLLTHSSAQAAHNTECLYRTCAGLTTFKIRDPDPYAVDSGNILGLRIEAFGNFRYVRPYYVFLNKPYQNSPNTTHVLGIHRHTVPPCIPLAALAAKYLPQPKHGVQQGNGQEEEVQKVRKQDFVKFAKALRRECQNYHNRKRAIVAMQQVLGLDDKKGKGKRKNSGVLAVEIVDAEARQVRIEWEDGRIGRAYISVGGNVLKAVVIGEEGRDRRTERVILGGDRRIEGLAERILGDA